MAAITFDGVTKRFPDGTVAVDDVSLDVPDGEFMILVGPSGCGKTTALRMVAGLEEITVGRDLDRRPGGQRPRAEGARRRDGLPELRALPAHDRPGQHRVPAQDAAGSPKAEIDDAGGGGEPAARDRASCSHRKPRELSGGQRQRVAMGRAIVRHPQAFLMDEPLSNLDAKLRVQMRAELVKLHRRLGVTTLYVTHDQTEAMTLGQRVAVLRRGVVQQVDTPQRLYHRPANTFVAGFIGSPPMNFAEGTLSGGALELGGRLASSSRTGCVPSRRGRSGPSWSGSGPSTSRTPRLEGDGAADGARPRSRSPSSSAPRRTPTSGSPGSRPPRSASVRSSSPARSRRGSTRARPLRRAERSTLAIDLDGVQLFDRESGESILGD